MPAAAPNTPTQIATETPAASPELVEFAATHTADSTLDVDNDDGLVARYWKIKDLLGEGEPSGLAARELEEEVAEKHAISVDEPNSFTEAEKNLC